MKKAEVSLKANEARVEFDDAKTSPEKLRVAIDRLGFRAKVVSVGRVGP